ncbi:Fanconi anemia group D2 protein [Physocladia obscura]|uniref:Fanconi anemia group D2 protein n=1 Tax=Physocladia obscura TaxID=109957 RepID=A0AAD5TE21_9FUNG|nr:Fanconi anemia group D2 protein [Physocladia obscura]
MSFTQKGKARSTNQQKGDIIDRLGFEEMLTASGLVFDSDGRALRLECSGSQFRRSLERSLRQAGHLPATVKTFIAGFNAHIASNNTVSALSANSFAESRAVICERAARFRALLVRLPTSDDTDQSSKDFRIASNYSVIKILMSIPDLQTKILGILIDKLPEFTHHDIPANANLNENIPLLILHQLRFLDHVVDPNILTVKLIDLLNATATNISVQKDVIECIPEIIPDSGIPAIIDALENCMERNSEVTVDVLDALGTIGVPADLLAGIRETVIDLLKEAELESLPVVIRFLLQTATSDDIVALVPEIRNALDLDAISSSLDHGNSDATLIFDALRNGITRQKSTLEAWLKFIAEIKKQENHLPIDLIVLTLLRSDLQIQKKVDALIKSKVKNSLISQKLVEISFKQFFSGLQQLGFFLNDFARYFPDILGLCENLLREGEAFQKVAMQMYCSSFTVFDAQNQQQLIGCLIAHIGSGVLHEVDCALNILLTLTECTPEAVKPIESVEEPESEITFESGLLSDMQIIIRKQLNSDDQKFKQMGVLGAISLIKRLATDRVIEASFVAPSSSKSPNVGRIPISCTIALNLVTQIFKSCQRNSMSKMHPSFVAWVSESFQTSFVENFVIEESALEKETCEILQDAKNEIWFRISSKPSTEETVPESELSDIVEATIMDYADDTNESESLVRPTAEDEDAGELYHEKQILMWMPASFKLLQAVEFFTTESLSEIGQVLNMGLVMFNTDMLERSVLLDEGELVFSGKKCLQRINHILELQDTFDKLIPNAPRWTPIGFFRDGEDEDENNWDQHTEDEDEEPQAGTAKPTKSKKGKQKTKIVARFSNLSNLKHLMREYELDIFNLLSCKYLKLPTVENLENFQDSEDEFLIQFPQLLYLLSELEYKLEFLSGISSAKLPSWQKTGLLGTGSVNHSNLRRTPIKDIFQQVLALIPALCSGLESSYNELRKSLEESEANEDFVPKTKEYVETLSGIFDTVMKCFKNLFEWSDFRNDKLFGIFVRSLASRSNPESEIDHTQGRSSIATKFVKDGFDYFLAFKEFAPSLSSGVLLLKLLIAIQNCCDEKETVIALKDQISSLAKYNLEYQWDDKKLKNELVVFLLRTQIENSSYPFGIVDDYIKVAFNGLSTGNVSFQLTDENIKRNLQIAFAELVSIIEKLPIPDPKIPDREFIIFATNVAVSFGTAIELSKKEKNFGIVLRYSRSFVQSFVRRIIPVLNKGLKYFRGEVVAAFKAIQTGTRLLQVIANECKARKESILLAHIPPLRKVLEAFIFEVKKIMVENDLGDAFTLANLRHKNLKGEEVSSQIAESEEEILDDDGSSPSEDEIEELQPAVSRVTKKQARTQSIQEQESSDEDEEQEELDEKSVGSKEDELEEESSVDNFNEYEILRELEAVEEEDETEEGNGAENLGDKEEEEEIVLMRKKINLKRKAETELRSNGKKYLQPTSRTQLQGAKQLRGQSQTNKNTDEQEKYFNFMTTGRQVGLSRKRSSGNLTQSSSVSQTEKHVVPKAKQNDDFEFPSNETVDDDDITDAE